MAQWIVALLAQWIIALYVLFINGIMQFIQLTLKTIILHIKRDGEICGHPMHF